MLSSAQYVTPKTAAVPPATTSPVPANGSAGNAPTFAKFLNDQPDMLPPPAHTDPVPRDPESSHEPSAAPAPAANATRKTQAAAPPKPAPAQKNAADAATAPKAGKDAVAGKDGDTATTQADKAEATDDADTSGLAEFAQLIGLSTPAQPAVPGEAAAAMAAEKGSHATRGHAAPATDDDQGGAAGAAAAEAGIAQQPTERRATDASVRATDTQARGKADARADARADTIAADKPAHGATDTLQAAAASAGAPHAAGTPDGATFNFAAVLAQAQALPTAGATGESTATAQGQVHAGVHSNAFGAELGARVSLLALDGQQSAELQLNPADMGPVSVQIVVDGSQAQVSFHAAQAETRAALEKSLPDLAAALQGQGLTLSGGGVFQQAPKDSDEASDREESTGRGARASGASRIGAVGTGTAATPARRTVGLLDTFA